MNAKVEVRATIEMSGNEADNLLTEMDYILGESRHANPYTKRLAKLLLDIVENKNAAE